MIKVYFHLHSEYSRDSVLTLEKIVEISEKNGVQLAILTDHNNLIPKEKIEKNQKVKIILGEEIKTKKGEIIGIFLKEKIEPHLSLEETIKKIKEQGGLVIVPHPFDWLRTSTVNKKALLANIDKIGVVEIFNARSILNTTNKRAENFAKKFGKIAIVGSDAHSIFEINKTYIEMDEFSSPQDFLEKLKKAKFHTKKSSIFIHLWSTVGRILKIFK